jgi:BirA family transcriptional regulator, biotin operon repressor / biotin---[acetyl-CoA-carboxylase] ligase
VSVRASADAVVASTLSASAWYDGHASADLANLVAVPRVLAFAEVPSTLDVAHDLAARGALAGTLVLADAQSAGRGRLGRVWRSEPGAGVWLTLIERPATSELSRVLSLRVALALAPVLDTLAGERVTVKWPNDLFVGTRKLAGILLETRWRGERIDWLAAGVGINVRAPQGFEAAGLLASVTRIDVLRAAVPAIRAALARTGTLGEDERAEFAARDAAIGRHCREPAVGVAAGIDADGALQVDTWSGRLAFRAGSLVFADANEPTSGATP